MTNVVQGDLVLASEALLIVRDLKQLIIVDAGDHRLVKVLKDTIRSHFLNHRAKLARILSYENIDSLAVMCACIDPRAADLKYFPNKDTRRQAISHSQLQP